MQHLIYYDLSGRPKLRRFVLAAAAILLVLAGIRWFAAVRSDLLEPSSSEFDPALSSVQPLLATNGLAKPAAALPAPPACPTDPRDWTFLPVFPDDNYRRIEPACVYDGLAQAAAWMLLERLGYTKQEAADALGLDALPWAPALSVTGLTNSQGPLEIALAPEWPAHPGFHFWQVDRDGWPGVALGLRGCYRLNGSVYCVLALDRSAGSAVSMLGDLHFASHAAQLPGQRTFFLLEYAGSGDWRLLGQMAEVSLAISDPAEAAAERAALTERLGAADWDSGWLSETIGLGMAFLPDGWRLWEMDEKAVLAIAAELDRFIPAGLGGEDE